MKTGKHYPCLYRGMLPILASMIAVLLTCCTHEQTALRKEPSDIQRLVFQEISDPARAHEIVVLLEQLESQIKGQQQMMLQDQQEFMKLTADYYSTPQQFQELLDSSKKSRLRTRDLIIDTYFKVKAITTPQEWKALSAAELKTLDGFLKDRTSSSGESD